RARQPRRSRRPIRRRARRARGHRAAPGEGRAAARGVARRLRARHRARALARAAPGRGRAAGRGAAQVRGREARAPPARDRRGVGGVDLERYLAARGRLVERALAARFPPAPARLRQAVRYSLLAGARGVPPARALGAVAEVAAAAGEAGMVGGQALDLAAEGRRASLRRVQDIHRRKTGALLRSAVRVGALVAGADARRLRRLTAY